MAVIKLGSRKSQLAIAQTEIVIKALKEQFPDLECEIVTTTTLADNNQEKALYAFGGKPVWTAELEELLADGRVDMIVHSLKDVPTSLPEQFVIGGILNRADPRDALLVRPGLPYKSLDELPDHSVVGTSSIRRSSQLKRKYPNLEFKVVRGNINTRMSKLDDPEQGYTCIILAAAGLLRLDFGYRITQYLDAPELLYAVGQGAIGVEVKKGDAATQAFLDKIIDLPVALTCTAERSLMRKLEGGCSVPLGVHSSVAADGKLSIEARVVSVDGTEAASASVTDTVKSYEDAEAFGEKLAAAIIEEGAAKILEKIAYDKIKQ
ncbi:hypothetical protein BZA70DRAFT_66474 [Myxozyma melibiosi]|uniref:hydroxymethylbilane synthase n=1 Tax=Myxozyma melibiosi TaxID=54550 RepID=A0ABR1F0Z5_9ASCO